jgi:branched-chain amino acid transport system ATP-binding protein
MGIQLIPEGGGVLRGLTVLENLRLSTWLDRSATLDRAFEVFPVLAKRRTQAASTLSGGERQMLALAQAFVSRARLVLIDEASLGLAPVLVERLFEAVVELRDEGRSVLLVEQNAHAALDVANRGYVMEKGRIVESGPARKLATRGRLAGLYLGELDEVAKTPRPRERAVAIPRTATRPRRR